MLSLKSSRGHPLTISSLSLKPGAFPRGSKNNSRKKSKTSCRWVMSKVRFRNFLVAREQS
jgi:hypothetical protein